MYSGLGGSMCVHYAAVRSQVIIFRWTCTAKAKLLALASKVCESASRNAVLIKYLVGYYIIITLVQSYAGKYHEFVAVCIVMSAQHEYNANW